MQVEVGGVVCPQLGQKVSPVWETQQREPSLPPARRGPPREACGLARGRCTGLVRSEASHVPEHPGRECWMPLSITDLPRQGDPPLPLQGGPKSGKPLPGEATTPTVGVRTPGSVGVRSACHVRVFERATEATGNYWRTMQAVNSARGCTTPTESSTCWKREQEHCLHWS